MKRKDKRKAKTINVVVDKFETMQELAQGLNSTINNLYCGYLRQPISHDLIIGDNYIIHGQCSLYNQDCSYSVSSMSYHGCDVCNKYKKTFGGQ